MTETQQRFLRAIAERVPKERVVEVHLFPAIRQGGVETGVAVVAEQPLVLDASPAAANGTEAPSASDATYIDPEFAPALAADSPEAEAFAAQEEMLSDVAPDADTVVEADATSGDAIEADAIATDVPVETDAVAEVVETVDVVDASVQAEPVAHVRLTVHTARYRLTLKGVDRGKWEVDVVAEADAPLSAVDAVVRGVQRRAGEGAEPDRLNGDAFRDALEAPLATLER